MRYAKIDTVSFTDASGRSIAIKDIRPLEVASGISVRLRPTEKDRLDEIASRTDTYGTEGYRNAYKLFDQNAVRLLEGKLDLGKVASLEVPT